MGDISNRSRAIMEIAHAISQLRAITFMATPATRKWLRDELAHAEEHLTAAVVHIESTTREAGR